jgi:hypothetical protein
MGFLLILFGNGSNDTEVKRKELKVIKDKKITTVLKYFIRADEIFWIYFTKMRSFISLSSDSIRCVN